MSRVAILNAKIVDGTKKAAFMGHVIIQDDRIERIVSLDDISIKDEKGIDTFINGAGFVLSPGFIDTHSHSDLEILERKILEPKIRQGITTEILGQDGISMAPLPKEYIEDWRKNIAGLDGDSEIIDWNYETTQGYLEAIKNANPTSNATYLIPHGNVRMAAMGLDNRNPNSEELEKMQIIIRDAMELGCVGLSSGLIYIPCAYSLEEEIIQLCKVISEYDGVFVVHQRSEANSILESMDEIIRIGLASGVRIHFSHFKICGKNNWDLLEDVLGKLDDAQKRGLKVSFDLYPYTAGSTMLSVILPPWAHVGGTTKMLMRLQDQSSRERLKLEMREQNSKWDNFIEFAGVDGIYITNVKSKENKNNIGKNLRELGEFRCVDPLDAAFDLLIEENNHVGMIDYYGSEEHLKIFIQRDEMNVCTDGLLGGKPHPRAYGSFPRIISKFVNEEKILSLEEAIYKMTYGPASIFGLKDRGVIQVGAYADLILFHEENFKDLGTYLQPDQFPQGLKMVMINGHVIFDGDYHSKASGKVIRRERQK